MKNRFINFLVLGLVLFFNYITPLLSEEVNFEATKIETVNENLITASGDVYIYDNKGNEIFSDKIFLVV